jgi:hypothetical protein
LSSQEKGGGLESGINRQGLPSCKIADVFKVNLKGPGQIKLLKSGFTGYGKKKAASILK